MPIAAIAGNASQSTSAMLGTGTELASVVYQFQAACPHSQAPDATATEVHVRTSVREPPRTASAAAQRANAAASVHATFASWRARLPPSGHSATPAASAAAPNTR